MSHQPLLHPPAAPLVVQLGFAGSRNLYDPKEHPGIDAAAFHQEVEDYLIALLERLPAMLRLSDRHFLCAISSAACGADTLFLRACEKRGVAQRIFLPEQRQAFFDAKNKDNVSDFNREQAAETGALLDSLRIVEERVVSQSGDRYERFEDVNLEIVHFSDVLIALVRENAAGKTGGTLDLVTRAQSREKPVLQITVSVHEGHAQCGEKWLTAPGQLPSASGHSFHPPGVPAVLAGFHCAPGMRYFDELKKFASPEARRHQKFFTRAAFYIIGAHVVATVLAVFGLAFLDLAHHWLKGLLAVEIGLLVGGLGIHRWLHGSSAAEHWATARLVAEVLRSVNAVAGVRGDLVYLFFLPLPKRLDALWHTINFFHLQETRALSKGKPWTDRRNDYVASRLSDSSGQIAYYTREHHRALQRLGWAQTIFYLCSGLALAATLVKLLIKFNHPEFHHPAQHPAANDLAFFAIVLPVLAVAALSLAASFDLEARIHTYGEMSVELDTLSKYLLAARSEREFTHLVMQTEARLVGENAAWFSRRIYTGVT